MKSLKRIALFVAAALLLVTCLCACGKSESDLIAELAGTWHTIEDDSEEQAQALLESVDFYAEEIALCDLTSLQYAEDAEFTVEKTYQFTYDVPGTQQCVRDFFEGCFSAMYAGRTTLNEVYNKDFTDMAEADFYQFYADLYQQADFEAMLDSFATNAYKYDEMEEEPIMSGTFRIKKDSIYCIETGETVEETITYSLDGNVLVLTFSDVVQTYTR